MLFEKSQPAPKFLRQTENEHLYIYMYGSCTDNSSGDTSSSDTSSGDTSSGDTSSGDTLSGDTSSGDTSSATVPYMDD